MPCADLGYRGAIPNQFKWQPLTLEPRNDLGTLCLQEFSPSCSSIHVGEASMYLFPKNFLEVGKGARILKYANFWNKIG